MSAMQPATFFLKQSDTLPAITATLTDQNGNVANLTGATVKFQMTSPYLGNVVNATATIVNATAGQVSYSWGSTDTNGCGTFSCAWHVVFSGGGQETYPQGFYNTVQIDPALNSGFVPSINTTPLFNTIWTGSAAPTSIQGNNGDYWYNTTTSFFYGPKAGGAWPAGFLLNPSGNSLSSWAPPTANINMNGFIFTNLPTLALNGSSTSTVGLSVNNPSGTTADVADFEINGTKYWWIDSSGNLNGIGTFNYSNALAISPVSTSIVPLSANIPSGGTVDVAEFKVNGTTAWKVTSSGTLSGTQPLSVAPTSTSAVPATFNTPVSSTADVADFKQNGTIVCSVNNSGNLAILNGKQIDVTAANTTAGTGGPILGPAAMQFSSVAWTNSAGANPAIGNGTLQANYFKYGRMVTYMVSIQAGSTTTFGAGGTDWWKFSVPFAPISSSSGNFSGSGVLFVSPSLYAVTAVLYANGGSNAYVYLLTADAATTGVWDRVGSAAYSFAATSSIQFTVTYEATT